MLKFTLLPIESATNMTLGFCKYFDLRTLTFDAGGGAAVVGAVAGSGVGAGAGVVLGHDVLCL